jgi:hypothetical protein
MIRNHKIIDAPRVVRRAPDIREELIATYGPVWTEAQLAEQFWLGAKLDLGLVVTRKSDRVWGVVTRDPSGLYHSFLSNGGDRKVTPSPFDPMDPTERDVDAAVDYLRGVDESLTP